MDETAQTPQSPPAPEVQVTYAAKPASHVLLYSLIFAVILLILSLGGYLFIFRHHLTGKGAPLVVSLTPEAVSPSPPVPSPTMVPVTPGNANQILYDTDNDIQQSVDQAVNDLNDFGKIDASLDNPGSLPKSLAEIIQRSDALIAKRRAVLYGLVARIQTNSWLADADKKALISQLQKNISGLTSLKTVIDTDTDMDKAAGDAQQIFTAFRVYAVLEPQIFLLEMLDNLQSSITYVHDLIPELNKLVDTLKTQGKDTSQVTVLLTDIANQISISANTVSTDINLVQKVSFGTPEPQAVFQSVKTDIQDILIVGLTKVRGEISQMRQIFRQLIPPEVNSTPTP